MSRTPIVRAVALAAICLGLQSVSRAAEPNVVVVRAGSADALRADLARLARLADSEMPVDAAVSLLAQRVGLRDAAWVDGRRPLALALPLSGLGAGAKGLVGVFPVEDEEAALGSIAPSFVSVRTEETGVRTLSRADGSELTAVPRDGYLVLGANRDLVTAFDPASALGLSDLPRGSIAAEVTVEPLVPMAQIGLMAGRQMLDRQLEQVTPEETQGRGAMADLADVYFTLFQDLLNNTSRIQASLEVRADELIVHLRVLPKPGSTLAGLVAAQKGGLPEVARLVEPSSDALFLLAGRIVYTPEFVEAVQGYVEGYMKGIQGLLETLGETAAGTSVFARSAKVLGENGSLWSECYRGDFAGTFGVVPGGGLRGQSILGTGDPSKCGSFLKQMAGMAAGWSLGPDQEPLVSVTENALEYRGVQALRQDTRIPVPEDIDEEALESLPAWLAEGPMTSYSGIAGEWMLSTTGPEAGEDFRRLVDRVNDGGPGEGLTAAAFRPLEVGPGLFATYDLAKLADLMPGAETDLLGELPAGSGRTVYGLRFDTDAVNLETAFPLAFLEAAARRSSEEANGGDDPSLPPADSE